MESFERLLSTQCIEYIGSIDMWYTYTANAAMARRHSDVWMRTITYRLYQFSYYLFIITACERFVYAMH